MKYPTVKTAAMKRRRREIPAGRDVQHDRGALELAAQHEETAGPGDQGRKSPHVAAEVMLQEVTDRQQVVLHGCAQILGPSQNASTSVPRPALPFHHHAARPSR